MAYIPTIGLEVHCELKTKNKAFSNSKNTYGLTANSEANEIDMGYPGALPTLNKEIFDFGIKCAKALNCKINIDGYFDRKNYFYPDNSKNYQITQQDYPIGYDGYIEIEVNQMKKKIYIEEIHLEEDTAKSFHEKGLTLLDFNRSGIPLIEIVSKPNISNEIEAVLYVEKLREILSYSDISDVKIEEGSMRCDVNVSIRKEEYDKLGHKVEIKNVGSINSIKLAILSEIERQSILFDNNELVVEQTRKYDEKANTTILMRTKETKNDYRYFPEPDIPRVHIDDAWINSIQLPVLPDELREKYRSYGINYIGIKALISNKELNGFLNETISLGTDPIISSNLLTGDILSYLNKTGVSIYNTYINPSILNRLVNKIKNDEISSKMSKVIIQKILETGKDIDVIVKEEGLIKITNKEELNLLINNIINNNINFINSNLDNKIKLEKYIMGQVMKETNGNADPIISLELIKEVLIK